MTAGYWIVTASVTIAALSVLLAIISVSPEWRLPRRKTPLTLVFQLTPERFRSGNASDDGWAGVVADMQDQSDADIAPGSPADTHAASFAVRVDRLVRRRPNSVVIAGGPDLLSAGQPIEEVVRQIEMIVKPLSTIGCRTFVLGALPPTGARTPTAGMNAKAIAVVTRRWNLALSLAIARYGATIESSPENLREHMKDASKRPVSVEPEILDCLDDVAKFGY